MCERIIGNFVHIDSHISSHAVQKRQFLEHGIVFVKVSRFRKGIFFIFQCQKEVSLHVMQTKLARKQTKTLMKGLEANEVVRRQLSDLQSLFPLQASIPHDTSAVYFLAM